MNEQKRQILQMLAEGKINAEEAERLLDVLESEEHAGANAPQQETGTKQENKDNPKTLHIIVHDHGIQGGGHDKVHVKIPLVMIKAGMKLKSVMPDKVRERINAKFAEKGLNIDDMNFEKLNNILESLKESSIDIESDDEKVHIYCE